MAKAVAKKDSSWMDQYKGAGKLDIDRDDIAMPRIKLGQQMSPEVKIEKIAEEGDFIHTITKQVICPAGETLSVIAIAYSKEYIIWYDRDGPHGGGIAARAKKVIVGRLSRYAWDTPNIKHYFRP